MIDFKNSEFFKLKISPGAFNAEIMPILVNGENILASYKALRDGVVFTNKRIITINVQGMTGVKKDITSLPYSKIQIFSTESAGVLDPDSELELWFGGLGKVKFNFTADTKISDICRLISIYTL